MCMYRNHHCKAKILYGQPHSPPPILPQILRFVLLTPTYRIVDAYGCGCPLGLLVDFEWPEAPEHGQEARWGCDLGGPHEDGQALLKSTARWTSEKCCFPGIVVRQCINDFF